MKKRILVLASTLFLLCNSVSFAETFLKWEEKENTLTITANNSGVNFDVKIEDHKDSSFSINNYGPFSYNELKFIVNKSLIKETDTFKEYFRKLYGINNEMVIDSDSGTVTIRKFDSNVLFKIILVLKNCDDVIDIVLNRQLKENSLDESVGE